jgi:transposase InsO family protein
MQPLNNFSFSQQAQESHALHHQNPNARRKQFHISREQAHQIVRMCTSCQQHFSVPTFGINPQGLLPGHLWQMDVAHISEFGRSWFVQVTIDTFSHFISATAHTGEAIKDIIAHCLHTFSVIGIPRCIKTDNAPAYTSKAFFNFVCALELALKQGSLITLRAKELLNEYTKC